MKSGFQFAATLTHNCNLDNNIMVDLKEEWEQVAKDISKTWNLFYDFWVNLQKSKEHPVYFIKFEDLIKKPDETIE